ncbi:MAG: hypothetical protein JSU92_12995 [Deltaproteobacteria bacterium]|nr:MAG: hypothetical protein JSU92_12995 [Deltaproteobacteria bacterium]
MKKFFLGFVVGIVISFIFVYFGGGRLIEDVGKKTQKVEKRIKREIKQTIEGADEVKEGAKKISE